MSDETLRPDPKIGRHAHHCGACNKFHAWECHLEQCWLKPVADCPKSLRRKGRAFPVRDDAVEMKESIEDDKVDKYLRTLVSPSRKDGRESPETAILGVDVTKVDRRGLDG